MMLLEKRLRALDIVEGHESKACTPPAPQPAALGYVASRRYQGSPNETRMSATLATLSTSTQQ
jgi:hypothetical protein